MICNLPFGFLFFTSLALHEGKQNVKIRNGGQPVGGKPFGFDILCVHARLLGKKKE